MSAVFIYQIFNHYTPRESLDPGFLVLDNSANEKPDWFEYWPIRNFLVNQRLADDSYYGFVSPKFKYKTNLSAAAARDFVRSQNETTDVVLLSPSIHLTAYHWNVFKFGDCVHPGLLDIAHEFFQRIGSATNLDELVTNSSNEVYSNYMIAKPRFWRAWLEVTEQLYAIAESPTDPLGVKLREPTFYRGNRNVQMKIFIMERIATWLVARDSQFNARARDPFVARSRVYKLPGAIVCDALKIAYVTSSRRESYKDVFHLVSRFGKLLTWQIRLGSLFSKPVRSCVEILSSYWTKAGES
ncbi:MAG: hypothetical protein M3N97_03970 [Pseudomonadota bacterium]|nr:hypothetical protein [Pseudomonadota bacterium]